jgi:hypothetical protein
MEGDACDVVVDADGVVVDDASVFQSQLRPSHGSL